MLSEKQKTLQKYTQKPVKSYKTGDNQDERTAQYIEKSVIFNICGHLWVDSLRIEFFRARVSSVMGISEDFPENQSIKLINKHAAKRFAFTDTSDTLSQHGGDTKLPNTITRRCFRP